MGVASCQSRDYVAPEREELRVEPLEIASNIAPSSDEYDVYSLDFTASRSYLDVQCLVCPSPRT